MYNNLNVWNSIFPCKTSKGQSKVYYWRLSFTSCYSGQKNVFIALLFGFILEKFLCHSHPIWFTLIFVIFPLLCIQGPTDLTKKIFTAWMIWKEGKWFKMIFWMIAEPDNELKLHNCVNKRLLHTHYIEKKV